MSRYTKLEGVIISDDKEVFFFDLYLNPFQVESIYESEVSFYSGRKKETRSCCHLIMKSGTTHDVLGSVGNIINLLEC